MAVGGLVALPDLGGLDRAVGGEVAATDQAHDVSARLVGPGDPGGPVDHPRVHQVPDPAREQGPGTDVPLDEERVGREVVLAQHGHLGGLERRLDALHVDLAVTGQPHAQQFPVLAGLTDLEQHVLQRVRRCHLASEARSIGPVDQRRDRRRVGGVVDDGIGEPLERTGGRYRGHHGLDVGRVLPVRRPDEGVLPRRGDRQELLGRRSAHRARGGGADHVLDAQAVEDALVGLPVHLVRACETGVVEVEGVRVLHGELAAPEDPGTGPLLVPVLGLDLVQGDGQVLVRGVLALHRECEQLLVGGAEEHVVALAVLETEQRRSVLGPPARRLVGLAGQERGQADLLGAGGVHLLSHHLLDPPEGAQAERQPRVHAGRDAPDVAGTDQQFVAQDLGIGRVVAERTQEEVGQTRDHGGQA